MDFGNNHPRCLSTTWPNVCRYEVFLSFRGGDVRKGFIQFLYRTLVDSGIDTFIDYDGIEFGEEIMLKILQVIRHTDICIPVFSSDFASSKSCLKEVAEMVAFNRTIMPIFYDVSPEVVGEVGPSVVGEVGEQEGNYKKSFRTQANLGVKSETIDTWKNALHNVSRKRGWELEKFEGGEYALIGEVVSKVRQLLRKDDLYVPADLVGMDRPVQKLMKKLGVRYENEEVIEGQTLTGKRVVEISGLPGIGKSTLATVVYNKIHHLFKHKSFLKDIHKMVEQERLQSLQKKLIWSLLKRECRLEDIEEGTQFLRHRFNDLRVLIILDDVSDFKQINSLVGDPSWFGQGSRIIVTSTTRGLVDKYRQVPVTSTSSTTVNSSDDIVYEYELEKMSDDHALQLFHKYAQRGKPLQGEFFSLAGEISAAAGGIPFVVEFVGSFLDGKPIECWKEALGRLNGDTYDEVKRILKKRYTGLDKYAKEIFVDIACFFVRKDKTMPFYMWQARKYNPYTGIYELQNNSLVKTRENNELWMNNQLEVLGREIVKETNPDDPFKWRRLWNQEDIELALIEKKVAAVEALDATFDKSCSFPERIFSNYFPKLRYLKMDNAMIKGCEQGETSLLPLLTWLDWKGCHNVSSLLAFNLSKLVVLDLSESTSTDWQDWQQVIKKAGDLKVLILKGCALLAEYPVSVENENLERLNLERCSALPGLSKSNGKLSKLVSLNIKFCSFVRELTEVMGSLESLKELYIDETDIKAIDFPEDSYGKLQILSACKCKISSLSNSIGNLKSLSYLALDGTELTELPDSIGLLKNLQTLSLRSCRGLWKLPDSIGYLEELRVMDLSETSVDELPSSVENLRNLKVLKMHCTFTREFPRGIKNLERLGEIDFSDCRSLRGECDITGLSSLRVLLLENTEYSEVIGTDGQRSDFPELRFRISNEGTAGAQHQFHGWETTTQFEADGRLRMMS
ncbi:hypothetical protein BT93_G0085 [Corymbia citriodora subsp. variegata]|nr:hypothetical protein BT93_G0085 [Corymbia citriodora subsp. variegata]